MRTGRRHHGETVKLDREAFEVWLVKHHGQRFRRGSKAACPLAIFLTDVNGLPCFVAKRVFGESTGNSLDDVINASQTPPWALIFIQRVDAGSGTLSSAEALAELAVIP